MRPTGNLPEWRRSYARVCQFQRRMFGLTALPFLSYEAAFLHRLAIEYQLIPALSADTPTCCRLRRLRNPESQPDFAVASYAAAFGMLLAGIKLQDDVDDHRRWHNRLAWRLYRSPVERASAYLASVRPGVQQQIHEILDRHRQLEQSGGAIAIEDYCQPTGDGFALLFSALAAVCRGPVDEFAAVGRSLGQAIIAWDCAVDFQRDRIYAEFNPLRSETDVRGSLQFCLLQLARIGWRLPDRQVTCRQLVESVVLRVHRALHQHPQYVCPTSRLERWGLIRARGYQYARCDGCEALCAIGECAECGECGCAGLNVCGEGLACAAGSPAQSFCCCDACFLGEACCPQPKKEDTASTAPASVGTTTAGSSTSIYQQFENSAGTAQGDLNPEGFVMIGDQRLPARADGGMFIEDQAAITVVSTSNLGLIVRRR
ncbi:MAG: hypothetical protein KDA85_10280 [Planctomycetaceae bacterium]|nr:hypothetical protein [Planctomycetaceae bacterium]